MKNYSQVLFTVCFALIFFNAHSQCPTPSFSSVASACLNQQIAFQNNSTNASSYYWDFCSNDLKTSPTLASLFTPANTIVQPSGFKTVFSQGKWYGFITSSSNHLVRADFGADLSNNSPLYTDLGNVGGILAQVEDIDLLEVSGKWYAVIAQNNFSGAVLIDFGANIENASPTSTLLGTLGTGAKIRGVSLAYDGSRILMAVCTNGNFIEVVNFGNSFYSAPTTLVVSIPGSSPIFSVDILNNCNNWYIYASTLSSGGLIHRVQFGADLFTTPIGTTTYTIGAVKNPVGITTITEGAKTYVAVANSGAAYTLIDFGNIAANDAPVVVATANPSNTIFTKVNGIPYQGKFVFLGVDFGSAVITTLTYANACGQSTDFSAASTPPLISYTTSGTAPVLLSASNGVSSIQVINSISVSALPAPTIDFTSTNKCVNNNVNFTAQGSLASIALYAWDFGDTGTSTSTNPTHIYSTANTYSIGLTVTGSNGCLNSARNSLQVFNAPQASFNLPAASPICTNQSYTLTNTSTFDAGSNPTWQWAVNGSNISTNQNLSYTITSASAQTFMLTASIPGCSTQATNTINTIAPGPLVGFTAPATGCVGTGVQFTNTTTGTVSGYSWTFGDGNTSTQTNPINAYAGTGLFTATLSASNAAGCQNFISKSISIYSIPQPDFAIEAAPFSCVNYPAQFDNNTPAPSDSNISTWAWTFGDASNGTSTQKNPAYTYTTATNYNVSLQATTNFGCTKSVQKQVTILSSPQASFTNSPACINQNTQFTDASSGNITTRLWTIQGVNLSGVNPVYKFTASGSFPATLTVTGTNGCQNQSVKNIVVPVMPVMDFTVTAPCTRNTSVFQELNPGGADPSVAWNWNFGDASNVGSPVQHIFLIAGGYSVTLTTTRQSGCVYSISKNINIYDGPVASFTPSDIAGAAPLSVTFANTSTADTYVWAFGDAANTVSNSVSPTFTYTQLGTYKVLLTANNNYGCTDTLSNQIHVVVPRVDLAMKNFLLTPDPVSNSSKAVVTILNSGNIPFTNPSVEIDLAGGALLKETITGVLQPGKSLTQTLNLQIIPRSMEYICALVDVANDDEPGNDKQCMTLTGEDISFYPYPNPASGQVNVDWISAQTENIVVTVFKSSGEIAFQQEFSNVAPGSGQLIISTSSLSNGLYLFRYAGAKVQKTFRVMVAN